MREILFRGKRVDNGEWVEGDIVHGVMKHEGHSYIWVKDEQAPLGSHEYEVIPETVGQYTGILDKHGIKIFEGDILDTSRWYVAYCGDLNAGLGMNAGWYHVRDNFESWNELECSYYHEILGNIHDNPELLER